MAASTTATANTDLGAILAQLTQDVTDLRRELAEAKKPAPVRDKAQAAPSMGRELAYRFDAGPKWLEASGWKDQSARHRKAWPVLRRILELERWPGARTRATVPQLADYLTVSEDTVKRRLKDLEELEVIEREPGTGRRPTIITVKHPIATPVSYSEVCWEAGGMCGAPPGHLEALTGARKAYAILYGVEIPNAGETPTVPDQDDAPPIAETEEPPPENPPGPELMPDALPNTKSEVQGVHNTGGGGAECPPLETLETSVLSESVTSDAPASARRKTDRTERARNHQLEEIGSGVEEIPPGEVSEDAVSESRLLVEAVGRYDTRTRCDMARIVEYLHRKDEGELVGVLAARIRRSRQRPGGGGVTIARPRRYVLAAILDARIKALTPEERALAVRVAAAPGPEAGDDQGDFKAGYEWWFEDRDERQARRSAGEIMRGYEFLESSPGGSGGDAGGEQDREGHEQRQRRKAEDLARLRELLEREDEDGQTVRRILQRVQRGRTFAGQWDGGEVLAAKVAEALDDDHLEGPRWRPAVEELLRSPGPESPEVGG